MRGYQTRSYVRVTGLALLHSIPGVRPMRVIGWEPDAPGAVLLCYYTELLFDSDRDYHRPSVTHLYGLAEVDSLR